MSTPPRRPVVIPIRVASAPAARPSTAPAPASGQGHSHDHGHGDCCTPELHSAPPPAQADAPAGTQAARFRIEQMDCPTEERLIRQKLEPMAGVARLDFNLLARELTVHHRLDAVAPLASALAQIGMVPRLLGADQAPHALPPAVPTRQRWLLAAAGLCAVGAEAVAWASGEEASLPVMALAALSMGLVGGPTAKKGWIALRHVTLNIHFLMTLAVLGALLIGKWSEAAMVLCLFALAEAIEALSLERAREAVQSLSALAPEVAWVWQPAGRDWVNLPVAEVPVGSRIRVRAGERVPLDAEVTQGRGALDESAITGEGLPVDKEVGATLYAGSILADGLLEARSTATASGGTLARMAQAIQQAQSQRAPTQRFVDQFARWYTPVVVVVALLVAAFGPWLGAALGGAPGGFSLPAQDLGWAQAWTLWQPWVYQALVLLVIACPCALVVSTPVTVVSGLAAGAHHGILIKGGAFLEAGRQLRAIALDKTGTLTEGRPALTDCEALPGATVSQAEALRLAASVDAASTHPVAQAVVAGWRARGKGHLSPASAFTLLPGRGVSAHVDGQTWWLGQGRLLQELGPRGEASDAALARLAALEAQGRTAFVLFHALGPVAVLGVADTVRPHAAQAVADLHALGLRTVMLSGDNAQAVRHVSQQLGVDDARGGLLPQDKLAAIEALKAAHGQVAMVGDGVNDAPALARADIGLAMGAAGTATALETADVAIMDDDPRKLADFVRLSRATARVLWQNIALALGIKAVFFALAFAGVATLWMAVFADMGASLLVVFNGLRLLRWRAT
ncbi:MAG: heavy metal translocating P-type ATPase [Proteobacteria bacterium]|uniref:heavy metal translocating P-type ATPase n=1 Tax=Aquabacterium sp. TaxID=1872578 RepID=UPI0035C6CD2D|nr:heavy metal translocating P-type ATPase [Pseudomonadota bacterium]